MNIWRMDMRRYKIVDVPESRLEHLVQQGADLIEDGLKYLDHQRRTGAGRLDVLFVDSGHALVVAELKVVEDDSMLMQGLAYYDSIATNLEGLCRAYSDSGVKPGEEPRLMLIAPSFSPTLQSLCKWINVPISLISFTCIEFEDARGDIVPIFKEVTVPSKPEPIEVYTIEKRLQYITDKGVRKRVETLLEEVKAWDPERTTIDATKYDLSLKVNNRVFAYLAPRRKHFLIYTNDPQGKWTGYPVDQEDELTAAKQQMKSNFDKLR